MVKNNTGTLQTPGGHIEHGEDLGACAVREAEEETGLVVEAGNVLTITNDVFKEEGKHYITIFIDCTMTNPDAKPEVKQNSFSLLLPRYEIRAGELTLRNFFSSLQVKEPLKCEGWEWKTWDELKQIDEAAKSDPSGDKLFLPLVNLVKQTSDLNALVASKGL